jgi:uncharacterized membrane protein YebE (DUF533 family)
MLNKEFLSKLLASGGGDLKQSSTGSGGIEQLLKGKGGAALAGGALGYLLGSKKGRKMGGKVLTYGGLAALGVLAYKAYGNWQQQQQNTSVAPQTVDRLPQNNIVKPSWWPLLLPPKPMAISMSGSAN